MPAGYNGLSKTLTMESASPVPESGNANPSIVNRKSGEWSKPVDSEIGFGLGLDRKRIG